MRTTWRKLVEEAEAARERAAARDSVLDALTKYDFAEEAATRYAALDARGFAVDFQRTTSGADELSQRLWDDTPFRGGLASRDLLSAVERRGVSISPSGIVASFEPGKLTLESPSEGTGGFINFGLGGAGGSAVPMEWWRDYELEFDITVERKGLWILDRYDPIWMIFQRTLIATDAPDSSGVLFVPVDAGKTYHVVHAVCGSDVIHSQGEKVANGDSAAPKPEELRMAVAHKVRKGGIVFQLEPGAKVVLQNLRLRVYRTDAAEAVNAQLATPGR